MTDITAKSLEIFLSYAKDADNWSGTPLFEGSKEDRGNLTQLKVAGLVKTFTDEGCIWIDFTPDGKALALKHGIEI